MSEPTVETLAGWQALSDAATEGPWFAYFTVHCDPYVVTDTTRPTFTQIAATSKAPDDYGRADTKFIAAARTAVPVLLAAVSALTVENTQLRAEVERLQRRRHAARKATA